MLFTVCNITGKCDLRLYILLILRYMSLYGDRMHGILFNIIFRRHKQTLIIQ